MRYYRIEIGNTDGSSFAVYTSYVDGSTDPGALQIELDIPVAPYATPLGGALVRIWGVALTVISQASDFNGKSIKVFGGMQKGLPLANPAQSGLLVSGTIFQAFGNWIGTNQTVDFVIVTDGASAATPQNVVINWKKGTKLSDAVASTLSTAAPSLGRNISISPDLVLNADETGFFQSITQFAQYVKKVSADIVGGTYQGVDIVLRESTFSVYDGTTPTPPVQISFNDLIGQPTWIEPLTIQLNCVMRADLSVGDYVKMPQALVTTTQQSLSQYRDSSVFQGVFQIVLIRHVGSFRQPDASAWITTINAIPAATGTQAAT